MEVTILEQENMAETTARPRVLLVPAGVPLLIAILLIASVIRFGMLGVSVLDPYEARQALTVWQFWQPSLSSLGAGGVSPAYFTFTAPLFALLGSGDALARLAPALFGVLTVALPWLYRTRLGTGGALTVSALLAVSPLMNMTSANAGGESMAIFAAMLLFISWIRFQEEGAHIWLLVSIVALSFGLVTAPLFYSLTLPLALAFIIQRAITPDTDANEDSPPALTASVDRRMALLLGAGVFLAVSTFFFTRPAGLGDTATQLGLWIQQFSLTAGLQALIMPIAAIVRYELMILTVGAAAFVWASWRGSTVPQLLVVWFAAGLLLTLLQQGTVINAVVFVLPTYFLLGVWLNDASQRTAGDARWWLAITVILLGMVVYFNGARYLRVMTVEPRQLGFLLLAFIALATLFMAINFVRSWDRAAALQGGLMGIIVLFMIFNWGTARWMLTEGANDPREIWAQTAADDDLRMLTTLLQQTSWSAAVSTEHLRIASGVDTPHLRWYLRHYPQATFSETVPPGATHHVIITREGDEVIAPADGYIGADLGLTPQIESNFVAQSLTLTDTLRWWLFHQHPSQVSSERLILWVTEEFLP